MRNLHLDALRGYCLLAMTIDHFKVLGLDRVTFRTFGAFDTAEGFIFISGLVAGSYYLELAVQRGDDAMTHRAFRRSRDIYLTHVSVVSLLLGLLALLQSHHWTSFVERVPQDRIAGLSPFSSFLTTITLLREPTHFEVLPLYVLLIMLVPLLVKSWNQQRMMMVVAASGGIWILSQPGVLSFSTLPWWMDTDAFNVFSWQFLFVIAFSLGCLNRTRGLGARFYSKWTWVLGIPVGAFLALRQSETLRAIVRHSLGHSLDPWWEAKSTLGPLCILEFGIFVFVLAQILHVLGRGLEATRGHQCLQFLGQHSLQVFAWSVVLWCGLPYAYRALGIAGSRSAQLPFALAGVVSLAIPAWLHRRYRNQPGLARPGSPAVLSAASEAARESVLPSDPTLHEA